MILRHFRLLTWKNLKLRRYRWFITSIELILPILITFALLKTLSKVYDPQYAEKNETISIVYNKDDFLSAGISYYDIVYSPSNQFTDNLMKKVEVKLNNKEIKFFGVENESVLETYVKGDMKNITKHIGKWELAGIVFLDLPENGETPKTLKYKIRDNLKSSTGELYPETDYAGPASYTDYDYGAFVCLQIVIDEEFIKILRPTLDPPKVQVQAFPFPQYILTKCSRGLDLSLLVCVTIIITVLIVSVCLINDIMEEKESGIKEIMKVAGVSEGLIWTTWFFHAIIAAIISFTVSAAILKYPLDGPHSEGLIFVEFSVLWTLIMLFVVANVMYCFTFCAIFHKPSLSSSFFIASFIIFSVATFYIPTTNYVFLVKILCIVPLVAFIKGFGCIKFFEVNGVICDWSSITESGVRDDNVSLLFVFSMLVVSIFVNIFLTFYISAINPGKFGTRQSPFSIFKRLLRIVKEDSREPLIDMDYTNNDAHLETPPSNLEISVQIRNLYKNYGSAQVVKGVNLNIYNGEIIALLGHNGAGKTTTMSILTGLTSATAGAIYYESTNVLKNMNQFRKKLGLCSQEDRLFPYLTVIDHLIFFGMLKGATCTEATNEAKEYLRMMGLDDKSSSISKELSGGMKRKLCLAISLMGKAEVLILDEPTSGMDVQSRRKIWDLLLELRGSNRAIILTTHHMEEADILGDRIAIMHYGTIVCHGTGMFLKRIYGAGYDLTIIKSQHDSPVSQITHLVEKTIPGSSVEGENAEEVLYKLPLSETARFSSLFRLLENSKAQLGIEGIGLNCTTMEQVFLKVGGKSVYTSPEKTLTDYRAGAYEDFSNKRSEGLSLILLQLYTLFVKKILHTRRNLFSLICRIILPTFIMLFAFHSLPTSHKRAEGALTISLNAYPQPIVLLQKQDGFKLDVNEAYATQIIQGGGTLLHSDTADVVQDLLRYGEKNMLSFKYELLLAAAFNKTSNLLLHNMWELHSLPIALNTYSNALLKSLFKDEDVSITAINHPIGAVADTSDCSRISYDVLGLFFVYWYITLSVNTDDIFNYFSSFIIMERIDGFKHIQMMSNLSVFVYWLGTFICDYIFYVLIIAGRIIFYKLLDDQYHFLAFNDSFATLMCATALFGISGLLFTYVKSYLSNSKDRSFTLFVIFEIVCGVIASIFYTYSCMLKVEYGENSHPYWMLLYYVTKYVILFVPSMNYSLIIIKCLNIWFLNSMCEHCSAAAKPNCERLYPHVSYWSYQSKDNSYGILYEIQFLCIDIILYAVLLTMINSGYMNKLYNYLINHRHGENTNYNLMQDEDVKLEKNNIQRIAENFTVFQNSTLLLVDGIKKTFNWIKPFSAVKDVSFTVKCGERFGLLGVNGAGKSTAFKILTADLLPSAGDAAIENVKLSKNKTQYLSTAGYCAQTNCFIEELTGKEMLTLISSLRGLRGKNRKHVVNKWISILGLEKYKNQSCGTYSGGNKRKLCTAMSLIGEPRVVFLDEPTSGVDPVSRRKLYDVMEQTKASGQAVVLTSHSMEECENLCDRITIMVSGVMKCIGSAQYLKQKYAQGYSVLIKISNASEDTEETVLLDKVKNDIVSTFTARYCILKDEHKGLLYYQIKDVSLVWSTLFEKMEILKNNHFIIEDYTVSDTSLEEVFISFAKET